MIKKQYKVYYENHVHKSDGKYDKKTGDGTWYINEDEELSVISVMNLNKALKYKPSDIINYLSRDGAEFNSMVTEGFIKNGIYHFERITGLEEVDNQS